MLNQSLYMLDLRCTYHKHDTMAISRVVFLLCTFFLLIGLINHIVKGDITMNSLSANQLTAVFREFGDHAFLYLPRGWI
ncbi:hypothetical protein R50345_02335 [Paenibacillus sp. FSL R5-0345]|uniref:Uncharacterized protein n=1 Tax=Paenibacillus odorifer TaxID=189426 RepID=A0A1R0YA97_9BACL|nr:hypothetical protein R50345_02335 [Paenibacillus sp. FSL R5-0345]OMD44302.1 hypothetical protein BSK52_01875 [Paenibacillus odorifer]